MNQHRYTLSSAVTTLLILTAIVLPAQASALQLSSHAARTSSSAVAKLADSITASAVESGADAEDSIPSAEKPLMSPSGEKGSGLSGKVFARFVLPEDWISLAALPGARPCGPLP